MPAAGPSGIGRFLIIAGLGLAALGVVISLGSRLGFGRLPGDIVYRRGNLTVYFPVISMLILSAVLTLLANLFFRRR